MEDNAFVFTEIVCAVRICYVMAESCCILCQELFDRLVEIWPWRLPGGGKRKGCMSVVTQREVISNFKPSMIKVNVPTKFRTIASFWDGDESEAFFQQCYLCRGGKKNPG